ncbi:hypothetical protein DFH28DRAFT_1221533 [Melampsora americana]|nr:hypothetical protein DFH28DRAFT_1221533 [Melampsora americana]
MSSYLYPPSADNSYSTDLNGHNNTDQSTPWHPHSWSATPDPPSAQTIQDQLYQQEDTELDPELSGSPRKPSNHLSHSRSYPTLVQPHTISDEASSPNPLLSSLRSGSVGLDIPQPAGHFASYSFEHNMFQPSHQSHQPGSSLIPSLPSHQHHFHGSPSRLRTYSDASIQSSIAGHPDHFRSRSGSDSSSSWPNLHTPITPAEMAFQNNSYSVAFKSDFDNSSQFDPTSHHHQQQQQHGLSLSIQEAEDSQVNGTSPRQEIYELPTGQTDTLDQYNHTNAIFGHLATPTNPRHQASHRRMSTGPSVDDVLSSNRNQSPLSLDIPSAPLSGQRSCSPSALRGSSNQHLQAPMSAGASYSRSTSIDSTYTRARSSSLALGHSSDEGGLSQAFNTTWSASTHQLPAQIGSQFAGLHLEGRNSYGVPSLEGLGMGPGEVAYNQQPGGYHQYSTHQVPLMAYPEHSISRAEREALLAPHIQQYLSSTNRFLLGERTVLVLSGKVAQKSYGAEKRFLCPPPSALLLGCSWWSAAEADPRRPIGNHRIALVPPTTIISMSGEQSMPSEAYSEWMSMSGHVVGDQASLDDVVIAGRCVGKQLHISEVDEKTKRVEALVKVIGPGFGSPEHRHIGTFPSRPIKVISKPSKKRQSIKNLDLCIHHGTTIALFNRLRSQTVSTKYLCVSGPSASFPAGDWRAMAGIDEKPFSPSEESTCFVARTSCWDPFIIFLVDLKNSAQSAGAEHHGPPPPPGYPRPPANALPVAQGAGPIPIYYNQPIVLQCLSTAVVSPVMVIRKVDKGSTATGGASLDGHGSGAPMSRDLPVAPGEIIGDPVSQLHKIALEVMSDPEGVYANANQTAPGSPFPGAGSFLACLGENVGIHRPEASRVPVAASSMISPPSSASSFGLTSSEIALAEATFMSNQLTQPISPNSAASGRARSVGPVGRMGDAVEYISSDGGKVKRTRRVSASQTSSSGMGRVIGPGKAGRRRAGSSASTGGYSDLGAESSDGMHHNYHPHHHHAMQHGAYSAPQQPPNAAKVWTIECGEPAVWTIVGCDVERHTFWVPPVLFDSKPSSAASTQGAVSEVFRTPIPYCPIGVDSPTPIPVVHKYLLTNPISMPKNRIDAREMKMITIYGANFSRELRVWFGAVPSEVVEYKCAEVIVALPPSGVPGELGLDGGPKKHQIVMVREDGVVFPSKIYYTEPM